MHGNNSVDKYKIEKDDKRLFNNPPRSFISPSPSMPGLTKAQVSL